MFPIGTKDAEIVLRVFQATKEEFDDDTGRNIVISEAEIGIIQTTQNVFCIDIQNLLLVIFAHFIYYRILESALVFA